MSIRRRPLTRQGVLREAPSLADGQNLTAPVLEKSPGHPRATIVVPSFGQGRFLPSALGSIVAQAGVPTQSLIFDNCSQDETHRVLESFAGQLTSVTIAKDGGQSSALNRGFRQARGDILGWLNADDMLMPNAVERAVQTIDQTGADVVYGHCAHLDASGQFTGYYPFTRGFDELELRKASDLVLAERVMHQMLPHQMRSRAKGDGDDSRDATITAWCSTLAVEISR